MRLIDAEHLRAWILARWEENDPTSAYPLKAVDILDQIEREMKYSTVDAVPVIRCKECKHWQCDDYESYCDELGIFNTDMNSYCSYAKRR